MQQDVCESVQTEDVDPSTVYYLYDKLSAEVKLEVLSRFSELHRKGYDELEEQRAY